MSKNNNTPIVLLHGWGMNKQVFNGIQAQLPPGMDNRVQCLDLPGFGDNKTVLNPYSLDALSAWLDAELSTLMTASNATQCHIIGWSLGGLIATHFALHYADKVKSLGLIASSPKFEAEEHARIDNNSSSWPGIKPDVLSAFAGQLQTNHALTIKRFLAIQAMGSETAKHDSKQIHKWIKEGGEPQLPALVGGLALLNQIDLRPQLNTIKVPVFGLFGQLDSLVPIKAVQQFDQYFNDITITTVPKASHAPFITHPSETIQWLAQYFVD